LHNSFAPSKGSFVKAERLTDLPVTKQAHATLPTTLIVGDFQKNHKHQARKEGRGTPLDDGWFGCFGISLQHNPKVEAPTLRAHLETQ
jgi:hypothetical protein